MPLIIHNTDHAESSGAQPPLCHIVTPVGMMGYGFDERVVDLELTKLVSTTVPTAIILDSGSTDSGPSKLALGSMTAPRSSYKRDLAKLLALVIKHEVPLLFSSAGGDGSNDHVDEMHRVIEEIMQERGQSKRLKVLSVYSEVSKDFVKQRLEAGQIQGCGPSVPTLSLDDINSVPRIVAQMGCEPFLDAMIASPDFDIVIGGRAYDPSPYVAFAAFQALKKSSRESFKHLGESILGSFFHMGKIMECGGSCAKPKCKSTTATVYRDGTFDVYPLNQPSRCTPQSVAAHTLYEKSRPDLLYGPGGHLDLTNSIYTQLPNKIGVRVRGGLFKQPSSAYTIKLEAARVIGYRTIFIGRMRDPILTAQIDSYMDRVQKFVKAQNADVKEDWKLGIHKFQEGAGTDLGGAVFVVGEALAATQELANSVASTGRIACVHGPYPGQKATSGNFAMGIGGPLEIPTGLCAEFCIYHLVNLERREETAKEVHETGSPIATDNSNAIFTWRQSYIGLHGDESTQVEDGKAAALELAMSGASSFTPAPNIEGRSNDQHAQEQANSLSSKSVANDHELSDSTRTGNLTLGDIAGVVRSKNAGPYELTFDVIFNSASVYQAVKDSGLLGVGTISQLCDVREEDIIYCGFFDQALAFKATIPRTRFGVGAASGGYMEDDVHGSQQYLPLMRLAISKDLEQTVRGLLE